MTDQEQLRKLTGTEQTALAKLQATLRQLRYPPGWPNPTPAQRRPTDEARAALVAELDRLYEDGVSLADLGRAIGVSKQRVHEMINTKGGTA